MARLNSKGATQTYIAEIINKDKSVFVERSRETKIKEVEFIIQI